MQSYNMNWAHALMWRMLALLNISISTMIVGGVALIIVLMLVVVSHVVSFGAVAITAAMLLAVLLVYVFFRGYKAFGIGPRPRYPRLTTKKGALVPSLRFVAISDTHSQHRNMGEIPPGDVLIHAGDMTLFATREQLIDFNDWIGTCPHRHKIVIAGNHDFTFDDEFFRTPSNRSFWEFGTQSLASDHRAVEMRGLLSNCHYLQDELTVIDGISIYGSPVQPPLVGHSWAFSQDDNSRRATFARIPEDIDVLLTHSPPYGHGDRSMDGMRHGCKILREELRRVKPKFHVFGHVHDGYGVSQEDGTVFINASTTACNYWPYHEPVVFDVPRRAEFVRI